jgi:transcriptional regulator with XRE-family HTH domain
MFNLISIGEKIRHARTAGGLTQAELAERANVSRATISAIESGTIKEIGINRLMEIVRKADNIQPRTNTTQTQAVSRKSQTLDLSFPYDWSNSAISDEVLIDRVIERGIFEDIVRIYRAYGEQMLSERLAVFLSKNPASTKSLTRMFDSIISAAQKVA